MHHLGRRLACATIAALALGGGSAAAAEPTLTGSGVSGLGTAFTFTVSSPTDGFARFESNTARGFEVREGPVVCFQRKANRAVFGVEMSTPRGLRYPIFYVEDTGARGDRLRQLGTASTVRPAASCNVFVPTAYSMGYRLKSGNITLAS